MPRRWGVREVLRHVCKTPKARKQKLKNLYKLKRPQNPFLISCFLSKDSDNGFLGDLTCAPVWTGGPSRTGTPAPPRPATSHKGRVFPASEASLPRARLCQKPKTGNLLRN